MGIAYFQSPLRGLGAYSILPWNIRFDGDFVHFPNLHPSESFLMIPPEGWDCE